GDDPAVVVPAVVQAGQFLQVPCDAVRFAHRGGEGDQARELLQRSQQGALGLVGEQLGRELRAVHGGVGRVARHVVCARVGVLHVEDRVVVCALLQQLGIQVQRRVGGRTLQGVPQRIGSE